MPTLLYRIGNALLSIVIVIVVWFLLSVTIGLFLPRSPAYLALLLVGSLAFVIWERYFGSPAFYVTARSDLRRLGGPLLSLLVSWLIAGAIALLLYVATGERTNFRSQPGLGILITCEAVVLWFRHIREK